MLTNSQPLYIASIDYEKAFDWVEVSAVKQTLRNQGINEVYIHTLEEMYNESTATLGIHEESYRILIKKGERPEDTKFLLLFTACLQEVFRGLEKEQFGIRVNGEYVSNLRFADGIALLSNSWNELQLMITELDKGSGKAGPNIILQKTKVQHSFDIGNSALRVVKDYVHLGQVITVEPNHEIEVTRAISIR